MKQWKNLMWIYVIWLNVQILSMDCNLFFPFLSKNQQFCLVSLKALKMQTGAGKWEAAQMKYVICPEIVDVHFSCKMWIAVAPHRRNVSHNYMKDLSPEKHLTVHMGKESYWRVAYPAQTYGSKCPQRWKTVVLKYLCPSCNISVAWAVEIFTKFTIQECPHCQLGFRCAIKNHLVQ